MKLYRFRGRKEIYKGCGRLLIDPIVRSNLTELRKIANKLVLEWKKAELSFFLSLEELEIIAPTQSLMIEVLQNEDPEFLVKSKKILKEWVNENRDATVA